MAWRLRSLLTAAVLWHAVALNREVAWAYPTPVDFDGKILRWNITQDSTPITFEIIADQEADAHTFADTIHEAAGLWSAIPTSYFRFQAAQPGEKAQVSLNLKRSFDGAEYSAGYASFDRYAEGHPDHCAIFVSITSDQTFQAISKTILHELGHCVGLGHTLVPEAIMSYSLDQNGYELDIDDMAAVTRLYPADGSSPELPLGCSVGGKPAARSPYSAWPVMIMLIPLGYALSRTSSKRRTKLP